MPQTKKTMIHCFAVIRARNRSIRRALLKLEIKGHQMIPLKIFFVALIVATNDIKKTAASK